MSGSFVPYHLRQNKAIERNLFIDLLRKIGKVYPLERYEYISFGGSFLEDFKVVHSFTDIRRMISIELNEHVIPRQKFNLPINCIELKQTDSHRFINDHEFGAGTIIWLDYTAPGDLAKNLDEIVYLTSSKLKEKDVVKVTLNSNITYYGDLKSTPDALDLNKARLAKLQSNVGTYLPSTITSDMMTHALFPDVLYKTLRLAFDKGMKGRNDLILQPLSSYFYKDGQSMFTFTGILLSSDEKSKFLRETGVGKWKFGAVKNNSPLHIYVPELSLRERLFIDALLPKHLPKTIQKKLKFRVEESESKSLEGIENYVKYSKQYPFFSKIIP